MENREYVEIPLAGNSFVTRAAARGNEHVTPKGWYGWTSDDTVFTAYVKVTEAGELGIVLRTKPAKTACMLRCTVNGVTHMSEIAVGSGEADFGVWKITEGGYIAVAVSGAGGAPYPAAHTIALYGTAAASARGYVKADDSGNFYWTRRGPSVHCSYDVAGAGEEVEWFYNEEVVAPGEDPTGTYAMAIGFSGGYFGIQVNGASERRILFSIWSPHITDDPQTIPTEKRVILRTKKAEVCAGEFGGEGSGGQSYMKYPWKSGETYRFLMHVHPVAADKTEFTAYFFFPESGKWELFASFIRPETHSYLQHPHSFLENFDDRNGHLFRKASYRNQWAVTKTGTWYPVNTITITADATARSGNREDYAGGVDEAGFFCAMADFSVRIHRWVHALPVMLSEKSPRWILMRSLRFHKGEFEKMGIKVVRCAVEGNRKKHCKICKN